LGRVQGLWARPALLSLAAAKTRRLEAMIEEDRDFDVLSGSAGVIAVMLGLASACGEGLATAHRCARHLLQHAEPVRLGLSWPPKHRRDAIANMTGFAHGAGGIGWALIALGASTDRDDYVEAGRQAFAYERVHFDEDRRDWYDLRTSILEMTHGRRHFGNAWCNGAAGIGLSRLESWAALGQTDDLLMGETYLALSDAAELYEPGQRHAVSWSIGQRRAAPAIRQAEERAGVSTRSQHPRTGALAATGEHSRLASGGRGTSAAAGAHAGHRGRRHALPAARPSRAGPVAPAAGPTALSRLTKKEEQEMSVASCTAFLGRAQGDQGLQALMRAVTDTREVIALGHRSGYSFDVEDLMTASSALTVPESSPPVPARATDARAGVGETAICHYELDLRAIPEMKPVLDELANLTIQPTTVDRDRFRAAYRREDLEWTSMSPAARGFRDRYDEVMTQHWNGDSGVEQHRRDFYLVNLDQHVDHPLYPGYFDAKMRTIGHLERVFGSEIQFSGSMWYPPFAYRLWHTNETQPGWRMYLIDFDEDIAPSDTRSFFRYMNPQTKEIVTLQDRPKMLRFFRVDQRADRLFWHCIVNGADRNRWSFGFVVPDDWMARLTSRASLGEAPSGG
jgi:Lanthionine synthetase C-like protein/Nif11 domain